MDKMAGSIKFAPTSIGLERKRGLRRLYTLLTVCWYARWYRLSWLWGSHRPKGQNANSSYANECAPQSRCGGAQYKFHKTKLLTRFSRWTTYF